MNPRDYFGGVVRFVPVFTDTDATDLPAGATLHQRVVYGYIMRRLDKADGYAKGVTGRNLARCFGGDRRTWTKAVDALVAAGVVRVEGRRGFLCVKGRPGAFIIGGKLRQTTPGQTVQKPPNANGADVRQTGDKNRPNWATPSTSKDKDQPTKAAPPAQADTDGRVGRVGYPRRKGRKRPARRGADQFIYSPERPAGEPTPTRQPARRTLNPLHNPQGEVTP